MFRVTFLLAFSWFLAPSLCFPAGIFSDRRQNSLGILPPSSDPFYSAPQGYEASEPGTVLHIRYAPGNVTTVVANSSAAYNILYRTTDSNYKPLWAVTTVLVPLQNTPSSANTSHRPLSPTRFSTTPPTSMLVPVTQSTIASHRWPPASQPRQTISPPCSETGSTSTSQTTRALSRLSD